jgi:hypothetical protein
LPLDSVAPKVKQPEAACCIRVVRDQFYQGSFTRGRTVHAARV